MSVLAWGAFFGCLASAALLVAIAGVSWRRRRLLTALGTYVLVGVIVALLLFRYMNLADSSAALLHLSDIPRTALVFLAVALLWPLALAIAVVYIWTLAS